MDVSKLDPSVLMHIPVAAPPPGVTSNFVNPPSRAGEPRIAIYIALPIMIIILMLRIYTRARITRNIGYDDYLAIAAAISVIGYCGLLLPMLEYPLGLHEWDVPVGRLTTAYVKENLASLCLSALAYMLVKCSILALYFRIFRPSFRANVMIWVGLAVVILFYLSTSLANIILYVPRPGSGKAWGVMSKHHTSMILNVADTQGVVGCFQDIYILIIPIHLVAGLRLPMRRKIGVLLIFITGFLATICAVIDIVYRFIERRKVIPDSLWEGIPVYTLSIVELNIGIMCSCFPVIVVFFRDIAKTAPVLSLRRYFRSHDASEGLEAEAIHAKRTNGLPKVPNGTLSGLKTFFGKFQQTKKSQDEEMSTFTHLQSGGDSYHEILRANH